MYHGKDLDEATSLIRGDEMITQNAAEIVYKKGNIGIGTIYTRMNLGDTFIFVVPCLERFGAH